VLIQLLRLQPTLLWFYVNDFMKYFFSEYSMKIGNCKSQLIAFEWFLRRAFSPAILKIVTGELLIRSSLNGM